MTPNAAYHLLNHLIWHDRLPKSVLVRVSDYTMPACLGLTLQDAALTPKKYVQLANPVILLNVGHRRWGKTLVHEMLHVAEPELPHGRVFTALAESYWRFAKRNIKGFRKP